MVNHDRLSIQSIFCRKCGSGRTSHVTTCHDCHDSLPLKASFPLHLVNQNISVSNSEQLASATQTLRDINRHIQQYEFLIRELTGSYEALKSFAAHLKSCISPIWKLPSDILLEVFGHIAARDEDGYNLNNVVSFIPGSLPVNMVLASVCRHWHQIMHSSPALWTKIHILSMKYEKDLGDHEVLPSQEAIRQRISIFLRHSHRMPLDINFFCDEERDERWTLATFEGPLFRELLRNSPRWRSLSAPLLYLNCLRAVQLQLPNLTEFTVQQSINGAGPSFSPIQLSYIMTVLANSSNVQSFDCSVGPWLIALPFPTNKLSSLHCHCITSALFSPNLQFENLQSLTLEISNNSEVLSLINLEFPALVTLDFHSMTTAPLHFTLRHFHCPALRTFSLTSISDPLDLQVFRNLVEFFERSNCSLLTFGLTHLEMDVDGCAVLLKALKSLEVLRLADVGTGDSGTIDEICQYILQDRLLPRLSMLKVVFPYAVNSSTFSWLDLLESRSSEPSSQSIPDDVPKQHMSVVALKSADVALRFTISGKTRHRCRRLRKKGMDVRVTHAIGFGEWFLDQVVVV